jgi:glycerophosphoryl diester phosphodiesterase
MTARPAIEVQGHRGARGLLPENTLPSFEIALDWGVTSIETDVHLSKDDVAILFHDARIADRLVRTLTLAQLRSHHVGNAAPTPLALHFAAARGLDPYGIPTLAEFFEFVVAYAEPLGEQAGKTTAQQARAGRLIFDLELKRVPFEPETIDDGFTGSAPALLERQVVAAMRHAGVLKRVRVRSFDHRSVWAVKQLEPTLETGLLIHETVPKDIGAMLKAAQAQVYCPDYRFVDAEVVNQVHKAGMRIITYTVNEPDAWHRMIAWGVDGITTDYPDRLLAWLGERGLATL